MPSNPVNGTSFLIIVDVMRTRLRLLVIGLALAGTTVAGCSSTTSATPGAVQDQATTSPSVMTEPTCAEGGACEIGDIGPGNGIVFYVASTPFFSAAP